MKFSLYFKGFATLDTNFDMEANAVADLPDNCPGDDFIITSVLFFASFSHPLMFSAQRLLVTDIVQMQLPDVYVDAYSDPYTLPLVILSGQSYYENLDYKAMARNRRATAKFILYSEDLKRRVNGSFSLSLTDNVAFSAVLTCENRRDRFLGDIPA
jgi:hypothetical protein